MDLVSGASSGLGKYLATALEADRFDRTTGAPALGVPVGGFGRIIHCANAMPAAGQSHAEYRAEHVALAEALLALPHEKFVFISSIDVLSPEPTDYGLMKQAVEEVVLAQGKNALVLRPGALLGVGMRPSQLLRVARGEEGGFSLAADSEFYPVFYAEIEALVQSGLTGVHTVVPTESVRLDDVAKMAGTQPQFGGFSYASPAVEGHSAQAAVPSLAQPVLPRLQAFVAAKGWQ